MIYMDHNATTPMDPEVIEAMTPYFSMSFGNASSAHQMGIEARNAVEAARQIVAKAIGAKAREIIFTSGGTEADNMAIKGFSMLDQLFTSSVEHHAVLNSSAHLWDFCIRRIDVRSSGNLDIDSLDRMIGKIPRRVIQGRCLVSVMHVNNETGNIMNVGGVAEIIKKFGDVLLHSDAVQSFGKIPVSVDDLGVDMLSLSAHKIYGPKGVGALYVRDGFNLKPLIRGGYQERNLRAGTENVAGIVGFGKAVEIAMRDMEKNNLDMRYLRNLLWGAIEKHIEGAQFNTAKGSEFNVGNTLNVSFDGVDGEALVLMLDQRGICVSRGAACEAGVPEPSHVLKAMGRTDEEANGAIRISLGRGNTMQQVVEVADALREIVGELRGFSV